MNAIAQSAVTFMKVCKKIHQALSKEGKSLHVNLGQLEVWHLATNNRTGILCFSDYIYILLAKYAQDISLATQDMTSDSIVHRCAAEVFIQEVEGDLLA